MQKQSKTILIFLDMNNVLTNVNHARYMGWSRVPNNAIELEWKRSNYYVPKIDPISLCNFRSLFERTKGYRYEIVISSSIRKAKTKDTPLFMRKDVGDVLRMAIPGFDKMVIGSTSKENKPRKDLILDYIKNLKSKGKSYDKIIVIDDSISEFALRNPIKVFRTTRGIGLTNNIVLSIIQHVKANVQGDGLW